MNSTIVCVSACLEILLSAISPSDLSVIIIINVTYLVCIARKEEDFSSWTCSGMLIAQLVIFNFIGTF